LITGHDAHFGTAGLPCLLGHFGESYAAGRTVCTRCGELRAEMRKGGPKWKFWD
jgi:hypothetical protein